MKHIVTLFLLSLICMTASAQINRTILNCTLGKSTEQDVIQEMTNRGYTVDKIGDDALGVANKIKFGGMEWTNVMFVFSHGLLKAISLQNCGLTDSSIMEASYNNFKIKLDMKYSNYRQDNQTNSIGNKSTIYSDEQIQIILDENGYTPGFGYCCMLAYLDIFLQTVEIMDNLDEI